MARRWGGASVLLVLCVACAHAGGLTLEAPRAADRPAENALASDVPLAPLQYVVADPSSKGGARPFFVMQLGKSEGHGAIVDGLRIVVNGARVRTAKDVADPPLTGGYRMPSTMGGGFVFRSDNALYTSESFDGALRPLVTMPGDGIDDVSFAPRAILVRTSNGERWLVDPKTGAPSSSGPPGLVDVASLPDGRAAAITEFEGALVSADGGDHWTDVAPRLPKGAEKVYVQEDALWLVTTGRAARVEVGGALSLFDKAPAQAPEELRPKDPRWGKTDESPIARALRLGAPLDDTTAVVVSDGNVVKVDLRSGELVGVVVGRLPPDATCEAVRAQDDIVAACTRASGPSFVASHIVGDKTPVIEQTFQSSAQFYASDDGAIAYAAPCSHIKSGSHVVCVRSSTGSWQEYDVDAFTSADGGAGASIPEITRWIPRPDGGAWGMYGGAKPSVIDARTGDVRVWRADMLPAGVRGLDVRTRYRGKDSVKVVDRTWTSTNGGTVRGWIEGGVVDVAVDGSIATSPFSFDRMTSAGAFAFARTKDGRAWQTVDRGASWVEVAAPYSAKADRAEAPIACSAVGCNLGAWYRIGWSPTAPSGGPPATVVDHGPLFAASPLPRLACRVGENKTSTTSRSERSPDDLGIGLMRLPVDDGNGSFEYLRVMHARQIPVPTRSTDTTPANDDAAPRALVYGYGTSSGSDDRITVMGPNKDAMSLRRQVAWVAPFDPAGAVRKASFGVSEIMTAARAAGMTASDVLGDDPTMPSAFVPVASNDAASPSDLAFLVSTGAIGVLRAQPGGGARARVGMRAKVTPDSYPMSAASLGGEDVAVLEMDAQGATQVTKWSGGANASTLFEVPPPASPELYPANPDALGAGAKAGEVAVIRTPSGGLPPTVAQPALAWTPGAPPSPLAAWSTLTLADDPACKADPGGWRAIVQTSRSWIAVTGNGLHHDESTSALVRVRWTATHVCLEGVEIPLGTIHVSTKEKSTDTRAVAVDVDAESWLVARVTNGTLTASRIAITPGIESRTPLECQLVK